ncbi:hypothetical protein Tco_0566387 [Tanacetum coccineum]
MVVAAVKHMALNFAKLDKFEGVDFRRWQKKMHFLISSMSVVYVLISPILEDGENATMDQIRRRNKWENDDYVCKGLILNGMPDPLFYIYQNFKSSKELWDSFKAKYMAKDASSKKFLISNFTNYKMTNSRPVMEQYNELLGIVGRFTQYKMNMDEAIQLGSHLRIEESPRAQDSDKPKRNNVVGPLVVNMDDDVAWWVDSGATMHVCKDRYWFKTYDSLNDRSILHMGNESTTMVHGRGCVDLRFSSRKIVSLDAIFDENRFSLVPRPSQRSLMNGTEDIGALVVPEEVTKKEQRMRSLTNTPIALMLRMTPKFDEAMKSQDIAFWKETINDEIDSILGNNT